MSESQNKAKVLIEEGNEALTNNKLNVSIEKFGEACQLLDQLHGDLAPENGDVYFIYGKALLQFAIQQNAVLGQSAQANATAVEEQQKGTKEVEVSSSNPLIQMESMPEFKDENDTEEDEEDEEGEGEPEEDFEAAWDILDAARIIFEKSDDKETQLKLADVHLCLADVSLETEKFDASLADYEKAIEIKEKYLEDHNRELAEAYYKFALALEFSSEKPDRAAPYLQKSIDVLNKRLETLKKLKDAEPTEEVKKEVKEIEELLPDMELKVEELSTKQTTEKETADMLKQLLGLSNAEGSNTNQSLNNVNVNDLSSFVKRKSKAAESSSSEQKKQKLE
ncbi:unnamed protein product [Rhizopus stolonifer]